MIMKCNLLYMIDFLNQIEVLLLNKYKLFKIPGFSRFFKDFVQNLCLKQSTKSTIYKINLSHVSYVII